MSVLAFGGVVAALSAPDTPTGVQPCVGLINYHQILVIGVTHSPTGSSRLGPVSVHGKDQYAAPRQDRCIHAGWRLALFALQHRLAAWGELPIVTAGVYS